MNGYDALIDDAYKRGYNQGWEEGFDKAVLPHTYCNVGRFYHITESPSGNYYVHILIATNENVVKYSPEEISSALKTLKSLGFKEMSDKQFYIKEEQ